MEALGINGRSSFVARFAAVLVSLTLLMPLFAMNASGATIDDLGKSIDEKKAASSATRKQIDDLQAQLDQVTQEYQQAYSELTRIEADVNKNQRLLNSAVEQQSYYQTLLNRRSVVAYRNRNIPLIDVIMGSRSFADFLGRIKLLGEINDRDARVLHASKKLRQDIQQRRDRLAVQKQRQRDALALVSQKQSSISTLMTSQQALLTNIEDEIKSLDADRSRKIEEKKRAEAAAAARPAVSAGAPGSMSMLFPIPTPYSHSYINDWGFARSGMSTGHQGTDVFAAKGTPLVAVVDGVIGSSFGNSGRGGYRLWVEGDNGFSYYYAHMNNDTPGTDDGRGGSATAFAPGIEPGVRVKAGQVIGYSGDSGEAETTPPHLHFGITTTGGDWINPYPYLRASDWK